MRLHYFSFLKNKYFIVLVAAFIWLLFFESHSFMQQWRINNEIREFKKNKAYYEDQIRKDSLMIDKINNDSDALERFAREKYFMKRKDEDIFIIEESN